MVCRVRFSIPEGTDNVCFDAAKRGSAESMPVEATLFFALNYSENSRSKACSRRAGFSYGQQDFEKLR